MSQIPDRPFTIAEARRFGVTARMLQASRFRRLHRGVYILAATPMTERLRLIAAQLAGPPDAVISHRSAQRVYGPELSGDDGLVHLSTRRNAVSREDQIVVHRRLHAISAHEVDGLTLTSPARTFVDCALTLTWVQSVVFGDWLIHRGFAELDELRGYARGRHLDGVVAARRAADSLVADSRSPMETLVRLILVTAGLPEPECNVAVLDKVGRKIARPDLRFTAFMVAVEYDGVWHERTADERRWQRDRREHLERCGWTVIVLYDTDLPKPALIVKRVYDALVRGGYRGPRPLMDDRWHRTFRRRI